MSSSGTRSYNPAASDLVLTAFSKGCGLSATQLTAEHMRTATHEANLLNAQWGNEGVCLWETLAAYPGEAIPLVPGVQAYSVPPETIAILYAVLRINPGQLNQQDLVLAPLSTTEWGYITNKNFQSRPTSFWWHRIIDPNILLWPVPDSSIPYTLIIQPLLQIQDTVLPAGVTLDMPQRFFDAWVDGMATRLSRHYAPDRYQANALAETRSWSLAVKRGGEDVMMNIVPVMAGYYRM